jgi:hypothetical protein
MATHYVLHFDSVVELHPIDDLREPFQRAQSSRAALDAQAELVDHREYSVAGQTSRPSAAVRERPLLGKLSRPMAPWFGEQATTQTLPQAKLGRNDDAHPQLERVESSFAIVCHRTDRTKGLSLPARFPSLMPLEWSVTRRSL